MDRCQMTCGPIVGSAALYKEATGEDFAFCAAGTGISNSSSSCAPTIRGNDEKHGEQLEPLNQRHGSISPPNKLNVLLGAHST